MVKHNLSISNFKLFLLKILLPFLFLLGGIGIVFNYFFEQKIVLKSHISGAYKINRILNTTDPNEIPIFGSSRAEMCLIPDSLGTNYFNYGLYRTRFDVTLFFLEQECKKRKETPWIIVNFDLEGLTYGRGDISNYLYNSNNPDVINLMDTDYKFYFRLPLLKYYGRFENIYRSYLTEKVEFTKVIDKGAALENQIITPKEFAREIAERSDAIPIFNNDKLLEEKLINLIKNNKNRFFVFTIAPYHKCCFSDQNIKTPDGFIQYLNSFKNVKVFDFSKLPLPDSLFFNTTHVNFKGAIVYTHMLRDSLSKLGVN